MLYQRDIIEEIKKVLPRDEFIIITGARQVGKTSIMILLKEYLEASDKSCFYINLENQENLKILNKNPLNIFDLIPESKTKQYVFIDEIQYLDNPSNFLKLLHDEQKSKLKIIVSGSSSFYISRKFKDSLVGRKFLFEVYTLSFREFLFFKKEETLWSKKKITTYYKKKRDKLWDEYITFGGYPKLVLEDNKDIKHIILEEIGTSYAKKDVFESGIKNTDKYFSMLRILASQTGELVNTQELANTLQMAHKTVEEYLYVMKKSYHLLFIKPFYGNFRKELTKMPKVYFYDIGLRNFLLKNFNKIEERIDKGAYLENIVFRDFLDQFRDIEKIKFWRTQTGNEVDFIVDNKAYEVKFNKALYKKSKYKKFQEKYPEIALSLITYLDFL